MIRVNMIYEDKRVSYLIFYDLLKNVERNLPKKMN